MMFCLWIKNDDKNSGYANGFVAIHKKYKTENALNTEINFGISQNIDFKFRLSDNDEYKNYFVPMIKVQKGDPDDFYIVGFKTSTDYLKSYNQHNVERALLSFYKDIESIEINDDMISELKQSAIQDEFQSTLLSLQNKLHEFNQFDVEELSKLNTLFYNYGRNQYNAGIEQFHRVVKKLTK